MLNNAKRLKINRLKLAYVVKSSYLCYTKELVINPFKLTIMEYEIYVKAMDEKKRIYGAKPGRTEIWKIYPISLAMACVEHRIWIDYKEEYVSLNNVMTQQEAYGITEAIDIYWQVEE